MLTPKHLDELRDSCIDQDLAALNFHSVDGSAVYEYLCYSPKLERLNAGRLASKWLDRYSHCEAGGWWASGLDPLRNWEPMLWDQFKPDKARVDSSGKKIKYEPPAQTSTRAYFFQVSFLQSWRIAKRQKGQFYEAWFQRFWESTKIFIREEYPEVDRRSEFSNRDRSSDSRSVRELYEACERGEYSKADQLLQAVWDRSGYSTTESGCTDSRGIERLGSLDDGKGFWESVVSDPTVPITVCEGAKKTACLLSIGVAAVGLPGATGAVRVPKDDQGNKVGKFYLIPEIEVLAIPGREFYVCFDQDQNPKTVQNVSYEILKLGRLLESKKCQVKVIEWESALGKGVDDLIFAHGVEAFSSAYEKALLFESWLIRHYNRLTYPPDLNVDRRYLGNIEVPKTAKLICLKSAKGTGKTETISQLASVTLANEQRVLLISHRVQLTQALCDRVGFNQSTKFGQHESRARNLGMSQKL